ncbi:MAG: GH92 family glycosyl hydrolase [Saprospiraceae bacterium]|jgi:predicted alpha-1,2-mannosidase|nr:GH92 family glycosyl hydrolase [Saprospiraceae bacterium]
MRFFLFLLPGLLAAALNAQTDSVPPLNRELLRYADPFVGTDAHGHTFPGATAPFGMVQLSPDTRLEGWDGCSGYHYSDNKIYGFSHTHLSGTGVPDYCDLLFQPFMRENNLQPETYVTPFDKKTEFAEPGYYAVELGEGNDRISVELTATDRVGVHKYVFPANREFGHILLDLRHRDQVLTSSLTAVSDRELVGYRVSSSWARDQRLYFAIRFSRPFFNVRIFDMTKDPIMSQRTVNSKAIVSLLDFYSYEGTPVVVTVALSAVSVQNARLNLDAECNHFDFNRVRAETQAKWAKQLGKITVEGGTEAQKRTFYSALYHTMLAPNIYSDVNGQYRGRDKEVHQAVGHEVYTVFSLWDTYRATKPLFTILEPRRTNDFVQTFLRQYEQGGLLPVWELSACETDCMIGNHAIPVITDAWRKGIRAYDKNLALEAMLASVNHDRYGLNWYKKLGYIPSDQEPESVSKTLEYAYDDWCVAEFARAIGRQDVADTFLQRAQFYKNLYDPSTGFFRARNNSTWHAPFDPFEVNFNYTEANAWQYRFAAPQDVSGMMRLFGGKEAFVKQLDALFTAQPKTTGRQQADITGLIGQYVQGNEPSHHMAYLYNYAGQPWKTQQRVRQILDEQYTDKPDGLSGNEDCGQMSAWYVLSAMGFYPVTPGSPEYVIGTPLFDKATIHLDNGKTFTVSAKGASTKRKYIQQAFLNGQLWSKTWFTHDDLVAGGELRFDMTDKPSAWGKSVADCPVAEINAPALVPVPFIAEAKRVFQDKQTIQLGCADPEAVIFYTLDGSEPSRDSSARYNKPLVLTETTKIRFMAVRGDRPSAADEAEFFKLRSDLRVLRLGTKYSNQYTGGGDQALVDLMPGGADFRSGRWQGYEGANLDAVLDLGSKKPIRRVQANFLQDENAWIFYPIKVSIEVSDDGKTFRPAGEVLNDVPHTATGSLQKKFAVEFLEGTAARYVRVVGHSLIKCPEDHKGAGSLCWIFADEVYVE